MKLNIGENIRTLRRQADMTQEQLAELLGVTYQSVSRWENGENYPDLELIPRLAAIFEVTADTLLNMTESIEEQFRTHVQAIEEALAQQNTEEVLDLLREVTIASRKYREQDLFTLFMPFKYQYLRFAEAPEIRRQLLKTAEAFLQQDTNYRGLLISSMAEWIPDEEFENFLKEYADLSATTAKALRLHRYSHRPGYWKELKALEQMNLLSTLSDICHDDHMWHIPCGISSGHTAEYLSYVTEFCLDTIHRFNLTEPDPKHPISGNGEPDMFAAARIHLGIHLAGIRTYYGDKEGAYTVLEDMVSLLEKLGSI
ncbi:MAG: helix-turn-helix transcriptional regulator [Clostridia bacterium]|nr:helix-turn-helix transcriptional regulator [Clostridia bacterium]